MYLTGTPRGSGWCFHNITLSSLTATKSTRYALSMVGNRLFQRLFQDHGGHDGMNEAPYLEATTI